MPLTFRTILIVYKCYKVKGDGITQNASPTKNGNRKSYTPYRRWSCRFRSARPARGTRSGTSWRCAGPCGWAWSPGTASSCAQRESCAAAAKKQHSNNITWHTCTCTCTCSVAIVMGHDVRVWAYRKCRSNLLIDHVHHHHHHYRHHYTYWSRAMSPSPLGYMACT